jgi:hypothetical protein
MMKRVGRPAPSRSRGRDRFRPLVESLGGRTLLHASGPAAAVVAPPPAEFAAPDDAEDPYQVADQADPRDWTGNTWGSADPARTPGDSGPSGKVVTKDQVDVELS